MQNGHLKMYNCPPHIHRLDLQLPQNATCQCTLCRKFTGALLPQAISIPTSYISPSPPLQPNLQVIPFIIIRISLFLQQLRIQPSIYYNGRPETTEIHLGSLDEEVLCGKKVGQAEDGKVTKRTGQLSGMTCVRRGIISGWRTRLEGLRTNWRVACMQRVEESSRGGIDTQYRNL